MGTTSSSDQDTYGLGNKQINEDYIHERDVNRDFVNGEYIVPGPGFEGMYVAGRAKVQCPCGSFITDDSEYCRKCGAQRLQIEALSSLECEEYDCATKLKRLEAMLPQTLGAAERAQALARKQISIADDAEAAAKAAEALASDARAKKEARMAERKRLQDAADDADMIARELAEDAAKKLAEAEAAARVDHDSRAALNATRARARATELELDRIATPAVDQSAYARIMAQIQAQEATAEAAIQQAIEARALADRLAQEAQQAQMDLMRLKDDPIIKQWEMREMGDKMAREAQREFEAVSELESLAEERSREAQVVAEAAKAAQELADRAAAEAMARASEAEKYDAEDDMDFYPCADDAAAGEARFEATINSANIARENSTKAREEADVASARAAQLAMNVKELEDKLARAKVEAERLCPTRCYCGQNFVWDSNFCRFCGRPRMQAWAWESVKDMPADFDRDADGRGFPRSIGPQAAGFNDLVTDYVFQQRQEARPLMTGHPLAPDLPLTPGTTREVEVPRTAASPLSPQTGEAYVGGYLANA